MPSRVTSYSDYYKKKSRTPGASVADDTDPIEDVQSTAKTSGSSSNLAKGFEDTVKSSAQDRRAAALKRRLKANKVKTDTQVIRGS